MGADENANEDQPDQPPKPKDSTVYERGQTVIPKTIRDALAIEYGTRLHWEVREGVMHVLPIPKQPVQASVGLLKGKGPTFSQFLAQRRKERERERKHDRSGERR